MKVRLDDDVLYRLVQNANRRFGRVGQTGTSKAQLRSCGAEFPDVVVHVTAGHFGVGAQYTL